MKFGLKEKNIEQINAVFSKYPQIEKAILYGSRAKDDFKNGSDIDLTITGPELNLSIINKISLDLDDLLLPYTFDVSIFTQISNPDLVEHIERVGIVFYEKNGAELRAGSFSFLPYNRHNNIILSKIRFQKTCFPHTLSNASNLVPERAPTNHLPSKKRGTRGV